MAITANLLPKFTGKDVAAYLAQAMQTIEQDLVNRLIRVGETFVKNARSTDTYKDQTGNLRSSIGYIILKDGSQIMSNFKVAGAGKKNKGTQGGSGVNKGQEAAAIVAAQYPTGYVLICVAGMEYAAAVESRGKDVITGSSLKAKQQLKESLAALKGKLGRL